MRERADDYSGVLPTGASSADAVSVAGRGSFDVPVSKRADSPMRLWFLIFPSGPTSPLVHRWFSSFVDDYSEFPFQIRLLLSQVRSSSTKLHSTSPFFF